jgi:flagellar export protein FliJ
MTNKQKRIQKVIVHREKELDRRVVELGQARVESERVETALDRERQKLERAAAERGALSGRAMTASEWREANEWLQSRTLSHAAVSRDLERANAHLAVKQTGVVTAQQALRGVELYEERLQKAEQKAEDRADQKLQDELARSRSADRKGRP